MIGIDLVSIERIEAFIAKHGQRGLERFLLPEEILLANKPETIAGFWAAKEACSKALGTGIGAEVGFHDIRLFKNPKGAPLLELSPRVKERFEIDSCALSITHDKGFAIAVVAMEKRRA
ncbi:MAG: holo-ACP synthase [Wolinella succinogenes]|uniref:holo-ACP synthase n=1 Tax=Wolinella succinogenes TaxID=844 RepID=UPI0016BCAC2B|nr:holo-ACP synthase [Wolinella succinogenes]NLU33840.1 holo-ACP synthase [Wolinella succinogenes]